jgi:hypothetical protein
MQHDTYPVDLLDSKGGVVGQKLRKDIDKLHDTYHGVYIFLVTPEGELILSEIPNRRDLPNLYPGKRGVTIATIRRHGEDAEKAARRALNRELFIEKADVHFIGEAFARPDNKHSVFLSAYYVVSHLPEKLSTVDVGLLEVKSAKEVINELTQSPSSFAPTFRFLWNKWHSKLPV